MLDVQDENQAPGALKVAVQQRTKKSEDYPPAPNPSADPGVIPKIDATKAINDDKSIPEGDFEVNTTEPTTALRILSRGIQDLSDMTGDVPATPPVSRPSTPKLPEASGSLPRSRMGSRPVTPPSRVPSEDLAGAAIKRLGSPEAHPSELDHVEENGLVKAQREAIARKFYSKKPPPISIHEYLLRLQRYCPMSTAVYLAAGAYIHKIAIEDKAVPVTLRTSHRLLLAALRVAMKALEDLNYPHKRFAGVGGVSEQELAKLEVAVCYLLNFELRVDQETLHDKARALQQLATMKSRVSGVNMQLKLPVRSHMPTQPVPFQASAG